MADRAPGYDRELYLLPFDHRGSFTEKLLGIRGRAPDEGEVRAIRDAKRLIYDAFLEAVRERGVPRERAGILADEQFSAELLDEARAQGFTTACPVERSGQDEFAFEYGDDFAAHLTRFRPTFAKALVRWNPEGDAERNLRQAARLRRLSEHCRGGGPRLLLELLVPPTPAQRSETGDDPARFNREHRTPLTLEAMDQLRAAGVEPDLWKLEGVETRAEAEALATAARDTHARREVGVILLGRGESAERVIHWLLVAAAAPGFRGFAVGRTVFAEALRAWHAGELSRGDAVEAIARHYAELCALWRSARARAAGPDLSGHAAPTAS